MITMWRTIGLACLAGGVPVGSRSTDELAVHGDKVVHKDEHDVRQRTHDLVHSLHAVRP